MVGHVLLVNSLLTELLPPIDLISTLAFGMYFFAIVFFVNVVICLISIFLEFYVISTSLLALFLASWWHRLLIFISIHFILCL